MKKLFFILILFLMLPEVGWGATYYRHPQGTAANKGAATGPCTTLANCMSPTVYDGETFIDGDVIVWCHTPKVGIPGEIWSHKFKDVSRTYTNPPAASSYVLWTTGGDTILWTTGGDKMTW